MLKTIIIEDEENVKIALENKLLQYCPGVKMTGWADSAEAAVALLSESKPDLVLLDIKLPDGTGFDILRRIGPISFKIIFITAYNDYAIEAFRFSALDYLLKPVRAEELIAAVEKAENAVRKDNLEKQLEALYENLKTMTGNERKIVLNTAETTHVIEIKNIIRCEADINYTTFLLADGSRIMVSKTLKEYEEMLGKYGFFRTHKSHLVNMSYLKSFEKKEGGYIRLTDNSQIPVSQRKRNELMRVLQKFS